MNSSNSIDYQASMQAEIFEKCSLLATPSFYVVRKFMNSKFALMMDNDELTISNYSSIDILSHITLEYLKKNGTVQPSLIMHWIGYIYRCLNNETGIPSKILFKKVPFNYLLKVYSSYHTLDPRKAVQLIKDDCHLKIITNEEKIRSIFKAIPF